MKYAHIYMTVSKSVYLKLSKLVCLGLSTLSEVCGSLRGHTVQVGLTEGSNTSGKGSRRY